MAAVNAVRSKARDAVFAAGGRGFVRFLPDGEEALLVSDALRRCPNPSALLCACGAAGFGAEERDGLLLLTPTEETLRSLNLPRAIDVDWSSADAPLAAFAARLMHRGDRPLTENGLRFAAAACCCPLPRLPIFRAQLRRTCFTASIPRAVAATETDGQK